MRFRQSLAKIKNQLQSQSLGATRGVEKNHGRSKWSNFGEFLQSVHEEFPSNVINKSGKP